MAMGMWSELSDNIDSGALIDHDRYLAISDFKWMGEQRRFDFLDVAHDSCGTMKKRPEDVWDSVLNPDAGHRKGFIEELEKWRVGFHHPAAGGEQYRVAHSRLDPPSTNEDTIEYLPDCDTRAADETVITHKGNPAQKATNCDVDEKPLTEDDVALQDKVESSRQVREIFDEDLIEEVLNMSDDDDEPPSPEASNRPLELSNIQAGQKRKRLSSSSLTQVRVRKVLKKEHNIFESPDAGYRIKSAAPRILGQHQGWLRRRVEETKMGQGPKDSIDLYSLTAVTHVIYDPRIDASIIKADRRIVRYDRHFPRSHHESKYLIRIALNREACEEYGMTAEGVAMMIAYNHQNVHSIFNREKYPVVRVRQIVEAGEDVTEQEAMDFAKLLMKTLLAKGPFFLDQTSKDYGQVPERIIDMSKTKPTATIFASRESPWAKKAIRDGKPLQPIDQPMKLSTLADVTGSNRTRGKVVNVLAKVYSVDDFTIKRTNMPLKRDIIITDETTYHKIPLSIFVDPFGCIPAVGSLCLFRNVVTHDFRKGALNAYPKQCEGRDWCLPFPYAVEGHHADLHQAIVRFLDDEDDRIIITTVMKDGDKFHSSLSARWPKHKRQLWKDHATEQRMKDIRTMRRWDLVNEPEICKRCDRPHEDCESNSPFCFNCFSDYTPNMVRLCMLITCYLPVVFTRGVAKLERRYTEWDEDDTMDCIAHEAVSSDESDDMDYEKEEPKDIRKLPKHHVREYWGDYP